MTSDQIVCSGVMMKHINFRTPAAELPHATGAVPASAPSSDRRARGSALTIRPASWGSANGRRGELIGELRRVFGQPL
jgi:hypothetical protein